MFNMFNIH